MQVFLTRLRGWLEASHPFPLAAVLLLTALIAVASSEDGMPAQGRLAIVLTAMLLSQFAIGWTNDYADRENDRRYQPSKPIAAGHLPSHHLPPAIVLVLIGVLALGVLLGPLPLVFLAAGTGAGLGYDLWVKETRWSWLPFIVAFAVLPPYVWTSLDLYRRELLLIYLIGLPLVPSAHIANVLPDIDSDRAAGRRNLALIWGRSLTLRILAVLLGAPVLFTLMSLPFITYDTEVLGAVASVYLLLLLVASVCYWRRLDSLAFKAVVIASVLFAGGWLAAV